MSIKSNLDAPAENLVKDNFTTSSTNKICTIIEMSSSPLTGNANSNKESLDLEEYPVLDLVTEIKVRNQLENSSLWKVIVGVFLGSLAILTLSTLQQVGCSEGSITPCMPQLTLQMNQGKSNETQEFFVKMQDALKTLSLFAKDFGIGNNNNLVFEDIGGLEHVSTFEEGNKFMFNYYGYCRVGSDKKKQCLNTHGLNVGATVIYDLGKQLAQLSQVSPNDLIDAFLMTYGQLVTSLSSVYAKSKANIKGFDDVDVTGLLLTERLKSFYSYSNYMLVLSKIVIITALVTPIFIGNIMLSFGRGFHFTKTIDETEEGYIQGSGFFWFIQTHLRLILFVLVGLFLLEILCFLAIMSLDIYVHWRLRVFENARGVVHVAYGAGFFLVPVTIAICGASMYFLTLSLRKRWA